MGIWKDSFLKIAENTEVINLIVLQFFQSFR